MGWRPLEFRRFLPKPNLGDRNFRRWPSKRNLGDQKRKREDRNFRCEDRKPNLRASKLRLRSSQRKLRSSLFRFCGMMGRLFLSYAQQLVDESGARIPRATGRAMSGAFGSTLDECSHLAFWVAATL